LSKIPALVDVVVRNISTLANTLAKNPLSPHQAKDAADSQAQMAALELTISLL